jgi:hypothetical protein
MNKYYVSNFKKGWRGASIRHALAAKGISTGRKPRAKAKYTPYQLEDARQQMQQYAATAFTAPEPMIIRLVEMKKRKKPLELSMKKRKKPLELLTPSIYDVLPHGHSLTVDLGSEANPMEEAQYLRKMGVEQ